MKIVITGSVGRIGKPLTEELVKKGHEIIVISSNKNKKTEIESLGAKAAIGNLDDVDFLSETFTGSDIAYCMIPPANFFDPEFDIMTECRRLGNNYKEAIIKSNIKKIIHLSSIGAHTNKGNGMLAFHYMVENILRELPSEVSIKHLRPVGFYYNLFAFIHSIKTNNAIITNYGNIVEPWVSTLDIARVAAEEMEKPFEGNQIRYIASDELNCSEVASILGKAIGKPELKWIVISDEELLKELKASGMNPNIAKEFVAMNAGRSQLYDDYYQHRPELGKVKMTEFAQDFARAYHKQ